MTIPMDAPHVVPVSKEVETGLSTIQERARAGAAGAGGVDGLEGDMADVNLDSPSHQGEHAQQGQRKQQEQHQGQSVSMIGQIQPESELHRFCAEGNVDQVRAVLSRGVDGLELLGKSRLVICADVELGGQVVQKG